MPNLKINGNLKAESLTVGEKSIIDLIYPVGSVYISANSTSPATLFGGTWEQIKDKFLLCAGTTYSAGATGGSATVTLTTAQMPSHTHTFTGSSATSGATQPSFTGSTSTTGTESSHTHSFSGNKMSGTISGIAGYGYSCSEGGVFSTEDNSTTYGRGGTYSTAMKNIKFSATPSGTVGAGSSHSHSFTASGTVGSHTHTLTAKGSNSNTGSGSAHDNMPPYLAVYVWKRTK